ncbi:MAG: hypothetical protein C5B59_12850 [Bacteroidetes bacterium]|nr:MAG: hypothetical protein C5B59_12850 [Bacteroidota bacterium]
MNISVVIPHVPSPELDKLLEKCVKTVSGYKELIVVVNDGIGYGAALNRGFKLSKGGFIVALSNDVEFKSSGELYYLCNDGAVMYSANAQFGCCFCMPRWVYERIGGFDETFGLAYYEDNDLLMRYKDAKIPVRRAANVMVDHVGGVTVKALGKEQEASAFGAKRWKEKWGERDPNSWEQA